MFKRSRSMPRAGRCRAGFTLVELLVAISVLAIVAVLGWRGLDGITRAREALTRDMEQTRGLQLAFAQMQRDSEQIVDLTALPDRAPIVVEPGRIVIVRKVFAENQPPRVQVVAYLLRDGVLSRRESASTRDLNALDSLWMAVAEGQTNGVPDVVLQSGVADMRVRTWVNDGAGWRTPGIDVVGASSDSSTPAMPTGFEVTLQLQGRTGTMTKVFLMGAT